MADDLSGMERYIFDDWIRVCGTSPVVRRAGDTDTEMGGVGIWV